MTDEIIKNNDNKKIKWITKSFQILKTEHKMFFSCGKNISIFKGYISILNAVSKWNKSSAIQK